MGAALLPSACGAAPDVPPEGVPSLFAAVESEPELYESALDGCVEVHHVWKAQIRGVHLTSSGSVADRIDMLTDRAYAPHSDFWDAYLGSDFARWAVGTPDLVGHIVPP